MSKICGKCRQPCDDVAGYWCGEPVCETCRDELKEMGQPVAEPPE